ncbi:MAG TPA: retention module-containing protein, partial [Azonexus sp.]|nr:retention module-containing protein [Azonexus sp.]
MAQAQIIAKVSSLSGEAYVRDSAGKLRRLKAGDVIREGEAVVAENGAQVVLQLADGREMTVRPGETAKLDAEVAATVMPDAGDSAVTNSPNAFQKIAKALTTGGDLDALLEDPAAGVAGPGNEGHTFVEFLRVVESVDPLSYQFGTARGATVETIEGAQVVLASENNVDNGGLVNGERPVLSIGSNVIIDEAAGTVTFTVTKTGASEQASSVDFTTSNGTALAGSDYTAASGTLSFAAGETVKTITVAITNDSQYEISEDFTVSLSNPANAVLGTASVTGTIVDDGRTLPGGGTADDDRPGFTINDVLIDEAAGTVSFTVTRNGDLSQAASVDYAGQDGT